MNLGPGPSVSGREDQLTNAEDTGQSDEAVRGSSFAVEAKNIKRSCILSYSLIMIVVTRLSQIMKDFG